MTIIYAILIFMLLIFIHELGHFAVAKFVGIKVNEFSIGMGPVILQKQYGDTKYSLRSLPIGGFAAMEGEDESSDAENSFQKAPIGSKIAVVVAGALMNFILAIIVFTLVSYNLGTFSEYVDIMPNSPAQHAGMLMGDKITSINGQEINSWEDIIANVQSSKLNEEIEVKVERENKILSFIIIPDVEDNINHIGVTAIKEQNIIQAVKGGFKYTHLMITEINGFFKRLVAGAINAGDVSGPVGVVRQIGAFSKMGMLPLLMLVGAISVNLGYFNLLPIPALDGGRLLFLLIELVRGKPINPEKEGVVHTIGFILLIILMIFITIIDIKSI